MSWAGDQLGNVLQIQIEVWRHARYDRVLRSNVPKVEPSDAKCLRALEDENGKLKKLFGLCCTNELRDSYNESSGIARIHAQLGPAEVQEHELIDLQ